MPLEKIASSQLPRFHREWLSRYELPRSSQQLISYLFDRDAGMSGLAALCSRNPSIPSLLGQFFDSRSSGAGSEKRTIEFLVSRLGLDGTRRVVLDRQLRAHFRLMLGREAARPFEFRTASAFLERIDTSAARVAYADSAFVAGLLWDVLEIESLAGRARTWVESRRDLAFERLESAIELAEQAGGFPAKRWLAGCLSAYCVVDAIGGLLDPSYAEQVLSWERRGIPAVVQSLLKSRHLGFSTLAAGAWICERIEVLRPLASSVRFLDAEPALGQNAIEVRSLAAVLGRATEMR